VVVVEVAVDVEIIKSSIVDIRMSSSATTMEMAAIIAATMINAMVAVVDIVGAVAMAAETLKEIVLIMDLEPVRFVKYASRRATLH
jgi:hypothetical protein